MEQRVINGRLKGCVEEKIPLFLSGPVEGLSGWHSIRDTYEIRGVGYGNEVFNFLFNKILREKIQKQVVLPDWDSLLVLRMTLNLPQLMRDGLTYKENLNLIFGKTHDPKRREEDLKYAKEMKADWAIPLFASGKLFETEGCLMLDGARRIVAHVLRGDRKIQVHFAIKREELVEYLEPEVVAEINQEREKISWFSDYQNVPELQIRGQRTLKRYSLFDLSAIKGKRVADFGCNIGQSCLDFCYRGAKEVVGFDSQEAAITTANKIARVLKLETIRFFQVDFNDSNFDIKIDKEYPDQFDYTSFFSLYRTKELIQRDRLFEYVISKTKNKIFFEGHADPQIDTLDYYAKLFDRFKLKSRFIGYAENDIRPCFVLEK